MKLAAFVTLAFALASVPPSGAAPPAVSFRDRVVAQEAIERVYYRHQLGATEPFETAVPRKVIEGKVRDYLEESALLESVWKTPVTQEMLTRELARMTRDSRMPARLRELTDALGNDPELLLECLARPALVGRLSRSFFDYDATIHAGAREEAEAVHADLESGRLSPTRAHARRAVIDITRDDGGTPRRAAHKVPSAQFDRWSAELPAEVREVGPLMERRDAFDLSVVLMRRPDRIRAAIYRFPKASRETFWDAVAVESAVPRTLPDAKEGDVRLVALTVPAPASTACEAEDAWEPTLDDAPEWRARHTAVWTGSEMLVWGGQKPFFPLSQPGLRYDPATDTWRRMSKIKAPVTQESGQFAVWAQGRLVVVGEQGGVYDPATDEWSPMSDAGAPPSTSDHTVVAVGAAVIVWGGTAGAPGHRYDWASDTWRTIATLDAPAGRIGHTAVSNGIRMLVWGGSSDGATDKALNTGAIYDPSTDTWAPIAGAFAPPPRMGHTAVWAGSRLIVWGGIDVNGSPRTDGSRYDPVTQTWAAMSAAGAPAPRLSFTTVAGGGSMLLWGGNDDTHPALGSGSRYDPGTDTWSPIAMTNAPAGRREHAAVWTGDRMIVWGGNVGGDHVLNSGGRYDPVSNSWTPTSVGTTPVGRSVHTAVWTGSVMIVWGGFDQIVADLRLDSGGRYDPATNTWSPTSTVSAPAARYAHTAVWTGSAMIAWGGYAGFPAGYTHTGGRYDPIANVWSPTSVSGAPTGRFAHAAVWTGSEMVVWGGDDDSNGPLNTGARYNPVSDVWVPTATAGAPLARAGHVAAWIGRSMFVWGGRGATGFFNTGARYDPATDSWIATSTEDAPTPRDGATAIWTGQLVVVWGGSAGPFNALASGALYDPVGDAWTATSLDGAPAQRFDHTATWTGHAMVVWGGVANLDTLSDTGGRYVPATGVWFGSSGVSAPMGRRQHTAVWTGEKVVIFGGAGNEGGREDFSSGALYRYDLDDDGDGVHNTCDNCPTQFNPQQLDADEDGEGDNCDLNDGRIFVYATNKTLREWQADTNFSSWNSYRGSLAVLRHTGDYTQLPGSNPLAARNCGLTSPSVSDTLVPLPGQVSFHLVTGVVGSVEGSLGTDSEGVPRTNTHPCP